MIPKQTESSYAGQLLRGNPQQSNHFYAYGAVTTLHSPSGASYLDVCLAGTSPALPPGARGPYTDRLAAPESFRVENVDQQMSWRPVSADWETHLTLNQVDQL